MDNPPPPPPPPPFNPEPLAILPPNVRLSNLYETFEEFLEDARWSTMANGFEITEDLDNLLYRGGQQPGGVVVDPMKEEDFFPDPEDTVVYGDFERNEPDDFYKHGRLDVVYGFLLGYSPGKIEILGLKASSEQEWEEGAAQLQRSRMGCWFNVGTWRDIDAIPDPLKQALIDYTNTIRHVDLDTDPMKSKISELEVVFRRTKTEAAEGSNYAKMVELVWAIVIQVHRTKQTNLHGIFAGGMEVENKKHMAFILAEALAHYTEEGCSSSSSKRPRGISLDADGRTESKKGKTN